MSPCWNVWNDFSTKLERHRGCFQWSHAWTARSQWSKCTVTTPRGGCTRAHTRSGAARTTILSPFSQAKIQKTWLGEHTPLSQSSSTTHATFSFIIRGKGAEWVCFYHISDALVACVKMQDMVVNINRSNRGESSFKDIFALLYQMAAQTDK